MYNLKKKTNKNPPKKFHRRALSIRVFRWIYGLLTKREVKICLLLRLFMYYRDWETVFNYCCAGDWTRGRGQDGWILAGDCCAFQFLRCCVDGKKFHAFSEGSPRFEILLALCEWGLNVVFSFFANKGRLVRNTGEKT